MNKVADMSIGSGRQIDVAEISISSQISKVLLTISDSNLG